MRREPMNNEKTRALVLMDACAFACTQDFRKETLREFETACRLAEKHGLAEVKVYRDFVASYQNERPVRKRHYSRRESGSIAPSTSTVASL